MRRKRSPFAHHKAAAPCIATCDATEQHDRSAERWQRWNFGIEVAGVTGLEPATSGVTGRRSNQLSYTPEPAAGRADRRGERRGTAPLLPSQASRAFFGGDLSTARINPSSRKALRTPSVRPARRPKGKVTDVGRNRERRHGRPPCLRRQWWAVTGSNRRPSRCKRDALPTELTARPHGPSGAIVRPRPSGKSAHATQGMAQTAQAPSRTSPRAVESNGVGTEAIPALQSRPRVGHGAGKGATRRHGGARKARKRAEGGV